ncbi:VrrA/YqfQ family protein [Niallia oryzisoli]|uniref:VrrA/YqfQ family protein n=1 Tax=Niallia oryzisoli TaxID=1737571 RepID=A0ABZ2CFY6_9BACI
MMPRYRFPMQTGMPPHNFNPYGRPPFRSMMGTYPQMQQRGGGGLLSRLLGRGTQAGVNGRNLLGSRNILGSRNLLSAMSPGQAGGGGSFLRALANPSSLTSVLSNTQKVLNTASQVGPLVQQYGPIVKNLPALWKLYRGLKDAPENSETEPNKTKPTKDHDTKDHEDKMDLALDTEKQEKSADRTPLPSTPKLYI